MPFCWYNDGEMTPNTLTPLERMRLRAKLSQAFSPSAPINQFELFAGRLNQVKAISQAIGARGRHAIIYGERGVGKTSLVTVLKEIYSSSEGLTGVKIAKINCDERDTFYHVWKKMLAKIDYIIEGETTPPEEILASDFMPVPTEYLGPGEVCSICEKASQNSKGVVLIFDEFDCLDAQYRAMFAPTIKELSDNSVDTTIILVGVSRDVKELIAEHASVDRSMVQINMPTMSESEIRELLTKVLTPLGMTIEENALSTIVLLSQGFPHYGHLLGQESAYVTVDASRLNITSEDVSTGDHQGDRKYAANNAKRLSKGFRRAA